MSCEGRRRRALAVAWLAIGLSVPARVAVAQASAGLPAIEVVGEREGASGLTDAASQGRIGARQLQDRVLLRPADVLEAVPGLVVTQHSGDGKANQYFLRGFNLDHGTDFATTVDGVPVNLPTHAHGHGYTDLNFVIPELVERIDFRKGPYFADQGDFSSAGAADLHLRRSLPADLMQTGLGPRGYRRLLAAGSSELAAGASMLGALELQGNDGPWDHPENLRRSNVLLRHAWGTRADGFDVSFSDSRGRWNSTDQVPMRALNAGLVGRFGAIDPTDGGETARTSLSAQWRRTLDDGHLRGNVYALHYRLDLASNFTYAMVRPDSGDQFLQRDKREVYGGSLRRLWWGRFLDQPASFELGTQWRQDRIRVGLFDAVARQVTATTRDDRVVQGSVAVFAEQSTQWRPWLRTVAGLRVEHQEWRVRSLQPLNEGSLSAVRALPKAGVILGPWSQTEAFLNWGRGFHSNDGRGTVTRVDPRTGERIAPVSGLVGTTGQEVGVRTRVLDGLQTSLALWQLEIGSELIFVGDAGTTEPSRPSRRQGLEWNTQYQPLPWLQFGLDLAWSSARFRDPDPAGDQVPGAVRRVLAGSVVWRELEPWSATLQVRHLGPRPLTEDGRVQAPSSVLFNGRLSYRLRRGLDLNLEGFNLLNRRVDESAYWYASQLRGEPAPVQDLHVHPAEPRTLRASARLSW